MNVLKIDRAVAGRLAFGRCHGNADAAASLAAPVLAEHTLTVEHTRPLDILELASIRPSNYWLIANRNHVFQHLGWYDSFVYLYK